MSSKVLFYSQNFHVFNPLFPVSIQPTSNKKLCKGRAFHCDLPVESVWRWPWKNFQIDCLWVDNRSHVQHTCVWRQASLHLICKLVPRVVTENASFAPGLIHRYRYLPFSVTKNHFLKLFHQFALIFFFASSQFVPLVINLSWEC